MVLRLCLSLIFSHRAGWSAEWPTLTCFLPFSASSLLPASYVPGEVQEIPDPPVRTTYAAQKAVPTKETCI